MDETGNYGMIERELEAGKGPRARIRTWVAGSAAGHYIGAQSTRSFGTANLSVLTDFHYN